MFESNAFDQGRIEFANTMDVPNSQRRMSVLSSIALALFFGLLSVDLALSSAPLPQLITEDGNLDIMVASSNKTIRVTESGQQLTIPEICSRVVEARLLKVREEIEAREQAIRAAFDLKFASMQVCIPPVFPF